ncbi:ATP-binding protein [Pedobacter changchengzhani]|nr:sensor histidine kinase [Pedobacter changchengzhani]
MLLAWNFSYAQNQKKLDSLEIIVKSSKPDSIKIIAYGDLSWGYGFINFDKALFFGNEELKLAKKLNNQEAIALAHSDIGNAYTRVNKFTEALANYKISYQIRDKLGLKAKAVGSLSNIAVIYKQQGRYDEAILYMTKALKIYEETGDEVKEAIVLVNIGNIYRNFRKNALSKSYFERAITLSKKNNSPSTLANAYSGMLQYYFEAKNFDEALKYANLAIALSKASNSKSELATLYNSLGQIFYEKGDYTKAMKFYQESLQFRVFMKDKLGEASCYKNIGLCYSKLNNFPEAEKYLKKSIGYFNELNAKDYLREAYNILSTVYENKQDYIGSLNAYKKSMLMKDSIYSKQNTDKISELQIAYETEKKEQKIKLLNSENQVQKLQLIKRNTTITIIAGAFLLALVIGFLFYNRYKLMQETRLQKEVIKQQDLATQAVLIAEENERKRISSELHDGLGQMFSTVKMNLSAIVEDIDFKNKDGEMMFDKTLDLVDESCKEVRVIAHQMAPNVLLKSGLTAAVRDFISKIDARKLKVNLETFGLQQRLDQNIETVLYRVIQESVNNVIKHANANSLDIQLTKDEEGINVMIEDNGDGFDTNKTLNFNGLGLKNMMSRVAYLKGTVDFSSQPGAGTLVAIHIPL